MEEQMIVRNEIKINAPIEEVWNALVDPAKTKIYMFGCEAVSDWSQGSLLLWKGQHEGNEVVFVKGYVVEINRPTRLRYTVFDPNSTMEDIQSNYLHVTYELMETAEGTLLTVTQDGFETAERGKERYLEVYNNGDGWNPILHALANLVEKK